MKYLPPITCLFIVLTCGGLAAAESFTVESPNGRMKMTIDVADQIEYSVSFKDIEILQPSPIGIQLEDEFLGRAPRLLRSSRRTVDEIIRPVAPEKRSEIPNHFNELVLHFQGDYSLMARAYDDGAAYRFLTSRYGKIKIVNEQAAFRFNEDDKIYYPETQSMHTSFESNYLHCRASDIAAHQMGFLPVLADRKDGIKIWISEADVYDYPGMFLTGAGSGRPALQAVFPPYPLEEVQENDRTLRVVQNAGCIALTDGNRAYPWRVIFAADHDGALLENDLVYRLAPSRQIADPSWIQPGKVAWDWWNALNLSGVNFKSGVNTETYKYYVDFAAQYGLEYVILDEGWSDTEDLLALNPQLDLMELIDYADQKNVRIILWCVFLTLDNQLEEAMDRFQEWGIAGVKVDFMDRQDQKMVNFYWRIAREAAKRHLLVDFHGAYKPTGLRRAFPNVITREGVKGLEYNKWSDQPDPEYNLRIPFIRMAAGPIDYTPGATINMPAQDFKPIFQRPMSKGTRAHQMAMYVVFESPLQMLADSPSHYLREPEMMEFLAAVPTTWDETRVLAARASDFILIARRQGEDWYVGAMTDWTPRMLQLDFSFLGKGIYQADVYEDGANADRYGGDCRKSVKIVRPENKILIDLKPGGGWAARISPSK